PRRVPKAQLWAVRSTAVLDIAENRNERALCIAKPLPFDLDPNPNGNQRSLPAAALNASKH
ncbi:hypothetical protein, partial [Methyloversatilis sp.]|uniref:hypothetical protein n=1 Tax=Methyloversatilis sp. TaxID=2569862 RepID=UPI003F6E4BB7